MWHSDEANDTMFYTDKALNLWPDQSSEGSNANKVSEQAIGLNRHIFLPLSKFVEIKKAATVTRKALYI